MDKLLFLTNELMSPSYQKEMRLPLTFIAFGITKGKMYTHLRTLNSFILLPDVTKRWGNDTVYGALMLCKDFDFYARILDAYHVCSMSTLLRNHPLDIHHRVSLEITPIYFNSLDELVRIKYREGEAIVAETYIGNKNHPKIKQRLNKRVSYRLIDGVDATHFKELLGEVIF